MSESPFLGYFRYVLGLQANGYMREQLLKI